MRYYITPVRWLLSKNNNIICCENVEEKLLLYTADGSVNEFSNYEKQ
jgi:hypothetical protein